MAESNNNSSNDFRKVISIVVKIFIIVIVVWLGLHIGKATWHPPIDRNDVYWILGIIGVLIWIAVKAIFPIIDALIFDKNQKD